MAALGNSYGVRLNSLEGLFQLQQAIDLILWGFHCWEFIQKHLSELISK